MLYLPIIGQPTFIHNDSGTILIQVAVTIEASVNLQAYSADKVWKQMNREGVEVARCTVEWLMQHLGLRGVVRGKVIRTTIPDARTPCPLDRVNRQFKAEPPNQLWVSDFTYVTTWQAGCMWPSSSTSLHGASSVGG